MENTRQQEAKNRNRVLRCFILSVLWRIQKQRKEDLLPLKFRAVGECGKCQGHKI